MCAQFQSADREKKLCHAECILQPFPGPEVWLFLAGQVACQHLYWTQRDPLCCAAKLASYMSATATYATSHVHHLHTCTMVSVLLTSIE